MIDEYDLSPLQLDALREIGNIGAGNSATALSQIINKKIDMQVPKVAFVPIEDVPDLVKIDWRPRCHCRGYREGDFCAFMTKPRQYSVRYAPRTFENGNRFPIWGANKTPLKRKISLIRSRLWKLATYGGGISGAYLNAFFTSHTSQYSTDISLAMDMARGQF